VRYINEIRRGFANVSSVSEKRARKISRRNSAVATKPRALSKKCRDKKDGSPIHQPSSAGGCSHRFEKQD